MFTDIVIPKGNERKLIETAARLGFGCLCLLYKREEFSGSNFSRHEKYAKSKGICLCSGLICDASGIRRLQPRQPHVIAAKAAEDNRELLENGRADFVFGLEAGSRRDMPHFRNSGLNHVLCNLAKERSTAIAFPFVMQLNSSESTRAVLKGRISQNIRLCRKYKLGMIIASFAESPFEMRGPRELMAVFMTLGMTGGEAKKALVSLHGIFRARQHRAGPSYISEAIELA